MPHLVAVYGTLRNSGHNHDRYLESAKFLGKFTKVSDVALYDAGLPCAARVGGTNKVVLEVYEIEDGLLSSVDLLEGHPTFYCREEINTPFGKAWMYIARPSSTHFGMFIGNDAYLVESGDWIEHVNTYMRKGTDSKTV